MLAERSWPKPPGLAGWLAIEAAGAASASAVTAAVTNLILRDIPAPWFGLLLPSLIPSAQSRCRSIARPCYSVADIARLCDSVGAAAPGAAICRARPVCAEADAWPCHEMPDDRRTQCPPVVEHSANDTTSRGEGPTTGLRCGPDGRAVRPGERAVHRGVARRDPVGREALRVRARGGEVGLAQAGED